MRFKVIEEKFGKQQLIKLMDSDTKEYVSILPESGGMLNSLVLSLNDDKLISVLDGYKTEEELIETLESSFKGSNLFPFPNRINSGKYLFNDKEYQLFVNFPHEDNAIHGLIFKSRFIVSEKNESDTQSRVVLVYVPENEKQGYPFNYKLNIEYIFSATDGLTISTTVENTDSIEMPIGHGWHPYLKLQSKVDELSFEFPSSKSFEVNDKMIPTGVSNNYTEYNNLSRIGNDTFDTCFSLKIDSSIAKIKLHDPKLNAGIVLWQETGNNKYNFLQVYTPEHRNTIAIEPMTCMPNAFNNKQGLIILKPGDNVKLNCGITKS